MKWTSEEDKLLTDTILEFTKNRKTISAAIKIVSKKTGRGVDACLTRWNKYLKPIYGTQVKTNKEKASIYWSNWEDKILVEVLYENFKMGVNINTSCERASDVLAGYGFTRTLDSCKRRWSQIKYDYPEVMNVYMSKVSKKYY